MNILDYNHCTSKACHHGENGCGWNLQLGGISEEELKELKKFLGDKVEEDLTDYKKKLGTERFK